MKLAHVLACLSSLTLMACAAEDARDEPSGDEGAGRDGAAVGADAKDALGVDLVAAGLSAGDKPCGDDAHVASIADEAGRYLAFCVSPSGDTSVLQVTPGGVAPVGSRSACALDTFLAASPEGTAVPRALVDACKSAPSPSRRVVDEPVAVNTPSFGGGIVIGVVGPCDSVAVFNNLCNAIDDYATHPQISDAITWCAAGPFTGNAQRTASTQGLPGAFEGRVTVAACGTGTTNLKGHVKRGLSGTWAVPSGANVNISSGHVATRDVHHYDAPEYDNFDTPYYGTDLRFTVTPSADAWYRYTGAYIQFYPVP